MAVTTANGGSVYGKVLTASASPNTFGSWAELTASTPETANAIALSCSWSNGGSRQILIDIGTGGNGAESTVIATIPVSRAGISWFTSPMSVYVPISIASGTRVSARCQSSSGSATVEVAAYLIGGSGSGSVVTYGAVTASSRGTSVDCGGSVNTKGAYSQLTASTSQDHTGLVVVVTTGANGSPDDAAFALDIATGGSGSETVQIADLVFGTSSAADIGPNSWFIPMSISSGTRIAARAQCSVTDATDRTFDVAVIGVTSPTNGVGGGSSAYTFIS